VKYSILHTKLNRPSVAPDVLPRERLTKRLDQGRKRPLTLISAPAGYGKSTLASRWLESGDHPFAWVSLDDDNNDLHQFLNYLLAAIQERFPTCDLRSEALLNADRLPPTDKLARYLLNDLHQVPESFIIVLDDYQRIKETRVHDFITALLKNPAGNVHLMLLTRQDPPLPLATMRGRGLVTEIRADDLRFTPDEAAAFLGRMLDVTVDKATADLLEAKTEGWATGLRLAGLYLRGEKNLNRCLQQLSGSSGHIAEYLAAEVLSRQHPKMVSYLLETSILDRFCAPLCGQMHQEQGDKQSEVTAEQFIHWLVNTKLFVITLDDEGYWFRYHHIFQAFLQGELRKQRTADRIADLHRAAGNWFAENDLVEEAIRHALAAGENQAAVRLVLEHRYDLMSNAQYHRLNNWLALLPRDTVAETPLLLTTQAITAWVSGQRGAVATLTEQAKRLLDRLSPESPEYAILQGEIITLHNVVCALNSEPASAWIDSHKAFEWLPKKAFFFRMLAVVETALCHQMKGNLNQGVKLLKDELKAPDLPISIQARGWFYLCIINYLDCNTSGTLLSGLKSIEISDNHRLAHTGGISKYFIGATHYLSNDLTKAKFYLLGVLGDRAYTNAIYVSQACGILGFIYLSEGCPEKAESVIEQAVDSAWQMQDQYSPAIRKALRVELALRQGMVAEARRLSLGVDYEILPLSWFIYMPQLTRIKLLLADGSDRSLEEARSRLVEIDQKMRRINRKCVRIDILALLALVCHQRNEHAAAAEHLQAALDLAEPQEWIRTFMDLGRPMVDLLTSLIQDRTGKTFAQRVLKACQAEHRKNDPSEPDVPVEPRFFEQPPHHILTRREIEILPLLAEGLSNQDIAARLYIAPVTVKKHLQNIYKKLNAKNRLEALKKSRQMGIRIIN
jgi:LuxR family maltose regulon positive regulatory protein